MSFNTNPFWNFLQHALKSPSEEIRSEAAGCLGDILTLSTKNNINQDLCRKIIGTLIRGLNDRFKHALKCELIDDISKLLDKGDETVFKLFIPQLHTVLIKALENEHGSVRQHGLTTLKNLTKISSRNESLIKDLNTHLKTAKDVSVYIYIYIMLFYRLKKPYIVVLESHYYQPNQQYQLQ